MSAKEVIRRHGISLDTGYRWKRKYGRVERAGLHRLQALEDENWPLKRMVEDQVLSIQVLKDAMGNEW